VMCKPKSMRPGWLTSVDASYILPELHTLLAGTKLNNWHIERDALRFFIVGEKE
jgi:hypothetical protein